MIQLSELTVTAAQESHIESAPAKAEKFWGRSAKVPSPEEAGTNAILIGLATKVCPWSHYLYFLHLKAPSKLCVRNLVDSGRIKSKFRTAFTNACCMSPEKKTVFLVQASALVSPHPPGLMCQGTACLTRLNRLTMLCHLPWLKNWMVKYMYTYI